MSNLLTRTATAIVLALLVIFAIVYNEYTLAVLFLLVTTMGLWEFYTLLEKSGIHPNKTMGIAGGLFLFVCNTLIALQLAGLKLLLLNLAFIFIILIFELFRRRHGTLVHAAYTLFGLFYIALPFSLINHLANPAFEENTFYYGIVLGFFIMNWVNDSGAYLVGSIAGKHKLFERISPKKTWEGTIGGAAFTLLAAWILSSFFEMLSFTDWMIIATIIIIFSSLGDLFESMFKRNINIKDSGRILPGHGGILDRFDGVIMSLPFVFVYIVFTFN